MTTTTAHSALRNLPTALAGRYALERELGRGGMATVFLARDLERDCHVAVKVLLPELAMSVGIERFLREIDVTTGLRHPRIVGVIDSGWADGTLYYVMPFVDGATLRDRLDRHVQLPIDEAIEITRQVAEALAHAHVNGIIHRDIKPENILFDGSGALVADFGVARAVAATGGKTPEKLTKTGVTVGTSTYMSPEQAVGGSDVTAASDIYSLGCVLYEMLAGQPPFNGPTAGIIIARHVLDTPPNLRIMRAGVNDAIADAIGRALAKSPADRFRSVGEFAAALTDQAGAALRRRELPNASTPAAAGSARVGWWRKRSTRIAVALAFSLAAASSWLGWRTFVVAPNADVPKTKVAVLYFEDRSPGKQLGDLANGLTEALMRQLDAVPQLDVASRNASMSFKDRSDIAIDSIARALHVGTLVSGRLTPVGSAIRMDLELWDGATGWRLRKRLVEQRQENPIALQDSLARVMTSLLRRRTGIPTLELVSRPGTRNSIAWDALQRGRHVVLVLDSLTRAGASAEAVRAVAQADSIFAVAQRTDEYWVDPHIERAQLAFQSVRLPGTSLPTIRPQLDSGLAHAETALELAPNDGRALEIRGTLRYWLWLLNLTPDSSAAATLLASAEADLMAAASRERSRASAWNALSHLLLNRSQLARAAAAAERALELDPFLPNADRTIHRIFALSLDEGYADQAAKWCGEGQRRYPENYRFVECRLWLDGLPGSNPDMVEVWTRYDRYRAMSPAAVRDFNALKGRMMVAMAATRAGLPDSARHLADAAVGDSTIDPRGELVYLAAIVHSQLGDRRQAFALLGRLARRRASAKAQLSTDKTWWLRDLRADPRYGALTGRSR